jgi:hypothetical protein
LIHFLAQIENKKETELCRRVASISHEETPSRLEALIAAAKEIRRSKPKFNRMLKDWYPGAYLWVSREEYPRLLIEDGPAGPDRSDCYGPYRSRRFLEKLVECAKAQFHLCDFRVGRHRRSRRYPGRRSCSGTRLKRCLGACTGKIDPGIYEKQVKEAVRFLIKPLQEAGIEDKDFVKIINDRKLEKLMGGWRARRILKRMLKESGEGIGAGRGVFTIEEVGPDGAKNIYLIQDGLLRNSWQIDETVSEATVKQEIRDALHLKVSRPDEQEAMIERFVIQDYLASTKAYRRIIDLGV